MSLKVQEMIPHAEERSRDESIPSSISRWRIAARVNSFRQDGSTVLAAIRRMSHVSGLNALELNYPQHFNSTSMIDIMAVTTETKLPVTALNLRFEGAECRNGAFTSPDPGDRGRAIRIACDAVDCAATLGADHVVLWMADDGWDYSFQANYDDLWRHEIDGFRAVAEHNSNIRVSVEYKPSEPRRFSLIRSMGDAMVAATEVGKANFGVTLDICHAYMAGEHPAASAAMALRQGRLFGVHVNDGYGRADDGLTLASVHERDTLELLHILRQARYSGTLYFDTFPIREDPEAELAANIRELDRLLRALDSIEQAELLAAQRAQDSIAANRAVGYS